jgi:lauroyl/myristoyl acyltransferase
MYYRSISSLAGGLGPKGLERLAGLLAAVRYAGNRGRNETYLGHLARIFPDSTEADLKRVLKAYWRVHQRAFLGLFHSRRFNEDYIRGRVESGSLDVLDRAVDHGRGVLLLVPHFGDERTLHILLAIMGYRMHVISSRYEGAPDVLREARLSVSMKWHNVAFPDQPLRWLYEALGRGEIVQVSPTGYGGVKGHWVKSFGVPVLASSTPVRVARSTGCRLVIGYNSVLPEMRYNMEFQDFRPDSLDVSATAGVFSRFEQLGRKHPDQYNWMNLVIRHRETNTIARLGRIPPLEKELEAQTVPSDWDPATIADPQTVSSISSGTESALLL